MSKSRSPHFFLWPRGLGFFQFHAPLRSLCSVCGWFCCNTVPITDAIPSRSSKADLQSAWSWKRTTDGERSGERSTIYSLCVYSPSGIWERELGKQKQRLRFYCLDAFISRQWRQLASISNGCDWKTYRRPLKPSGKLFQTALDSRELMQTW